MRYEDWKAKQKQERQAWLALRKSSRKKRQAQKQTLNFVIPDRPERSVNLRPFVTPKK